MSESSGGFPRRRSVLRSGPRRTSPVGRAAACALAATLLMFGQLVGQERGLEEVDRLARAGLTDDARSALSGWWASDHDGASREGRQRALWLRALLTVDPGEAIRDFQRLTVLYPGGPFTDRALFRLAQAEHALGRADAARMHVEALARDYPESATRREAEDWLESAGDPPASPQRPDAASSEPEPASGAFVVQVGAFGEEGRARDARARLSAAGFSARIVRVEGSPLLHVRVGGFQERALAEDIRERLVAAGLEGTVMRDDRRERPVPR